MYDAEAHKELERLERHILTLQKAVMSLQEIVFKIQDRDLEKLKKSVGV